MVLLSGTYARPALTKVKSTCEAENFRYLSLATGICPASFAPELSIETWLKAIRRRLDQV